MAQNWPVGVPSTFEQDGYSFSPQNGTLRSEMDIGPAKVRRRFTATIERHSGEIVMTKAQFNTWLSWFYNTIGYGALDFNFTHPLSGSPIVARIITKEPPFSVSPDGQTQYVRVSFEIEVLP
jgi:hypothetical protein